MYFLTEEDRRILLEMKQAYLSGRLNAPVRNIPNLIDVEDSFNAPEVYIAYPKTSDGIAALSGTTPGNALCDIYQVLPGTGKLSQVQSMYGHVVYNLSTTAIGQEYFSAKRDKFGTWLADTGGGGAVCTPQNAVMQITIIGSPTGGTFDLDMKVNATTESLTFNYDDTAAEVKTEMETHSEIASGDVAVTGGPFPDTTIQIEFQGNLANTNIELPLAKFSDLGPGTGPAEGSVITSLAQLGIA